MKPKIQLVTRADDAGSCRSANEAILECVEAGIIKNVSFLAVGPEIEHAAEILGGRDDISYGLHVCLNSEWETEKWGPLTNRPVLVDENGHFLPSPGETKAAIERAIKHSHLPGSHYFGEPADVEEEATWEASAQLIQLQKLGLNISYADEHMGVGCIYPAFPLKLAYGTNLVYEQELALTSLPDATTSGSDFLALESRLKWATGDCYVWVTHPGKVAPDMNAFYLKGQQPGVVARERDSERRLLLDPRLPELFARWKIKATRYDELKM